MGPSPRHRAATLTAALVLLAPAVATAQPSVFLSASHGMPGGNQPRDWLIDPYPLIVTPAQPGGAWITIDPVNFPPVPNFTGRVTLSAECCGVPGGTGSVSPGLSVALTGDRLQASTGIVRPPGSLVGGAATAGVTIGALANVLDVDIAGAARTVRLDVTADASFLPGNWEIHVRAVNQSLGVNTLLKLTVNALPSWPSNAARPACTAPPVEVLSLSTLNVHNWKAGNPHRTSYTFASTITGYPAGIMVRVRESAQTPRLAPTQALVSFKNTRGARTGVRAHDSRVDCRTFAPTLTAAEGQTVSMTISTADTTTLVFSKSTCRHWFIGCWGMPGLDDIVAFSQEAFWPLFGGRAIDVETVGDWSELPGDSLMGFSVATVTTP